jgi:hypothetical protein
VDTSLDSPLGEGRGGWNAPDLDLKLRPFAVAIDADGSLWTW